MRVVTTLPSATEIVAALGVEPVGVSHECDHPPSVRGLPVVTRSRIDASGTSEEIDRQVLAAVDVEGEDDETGESDGESDVYDVDVATLDRLDPDLVVTQGVCDVCAVDEAVVDRALDRIDADPAVVTTDPHSVGDVIADIQRIGRLLDREDRAAALVADLESRIAAVGERTVDLPADERPRVAVLDWTAPMMVAGHWMPELVEIAGGAYGMADPGDASRPCEWADVLTYDPAVLIVAPCGFDLAQTAANLEDLTERDGWADLTAVREGHAWAMDGHHYVNRPGPRLVDTLEALARIIDPDRFGGVTPPDDVAIPLDQLGERVES